MSNDVTPALGAPDSWVAIGARAVPALVLGVAITFSQDHSAAIGLASFGIFGVVTGAVLLATGLRGDRGTRVSTLLQGIVTVAAAVAALVVPADPQVFVAIVSAWAIIVGALDLVLGIRFRRTRVVARDWILSGSLTLILGLVFLLIPQNLTDEYGFTEKGVTVSGVITADVVLVGVMGAWAAIIGVLFAISAVSLRAPAATPNSTSSSTTEEVSA